MEGAFRNSSEAVVLNTRPISYREASRSTLFREPDGSQYGTSETGNEIRADDTDQGGRLGGVHAVLYPPAIAVLKQGEGEGGGFGIKDGIKQAGWKGKVLVRQRFIAGLDPSRPSQLIIKLLLCLLLHLEIADSAARGWLGVKVQVFQSIKRVRTTNFPRAGKIGEC